MPLTNIKNKKNITLELMNQISTFKTPPPFKKNKLKKSIRSKSKKKTTQKKKNQEIAEVRGFENNFSPREGDKTRSTSSYQDLGLLTKFDRNKNIWITNMGKYLKPRQLNKSWEIVNYRIYVLSLRPKPNRLPRYLPDGWPVNTSSSIFDRNETNENNVDLVDRNSNELENTEVNNYTSNNNNNDYDYRKLYMCVVTAPTHEMARNYILDNYLYGIENLDENGDAYENSIWLKENLSSCKDVGESFHQESKLLCITKY